MNPPEMSASMTDHGPCPGCGRTSPPDARFCGGCGRRRSTASSGDSAVGPIADPLIGQTVADRYRIVSLLGRGGMGVVYKIEHVHIGKLMAMKLLHGELARDRDTVKRFRREAEAASRLSHPNTVQVFDFGRSEGLTYLVMEFVDGADFGQVIRREGKLEFPRVARLIAQVCASLGEAHEVGIVHRDLKPENVMISEHNGVETPKVLDFGLAKIREGMSSVTVTRAGSIIGTPYYMSPEQIHGHEVDGRGDIYAIGAMIYKACTGTPPFAAPTPMGVLTKHLIEQLEPPSQRLGRPLPPAVDQIVGRAMQKDPAARFQKAEELRDALCDYLEAAGEELPSGMGSASRSRVFMPVAPSGVATREDVDGYERTLRRRGTLGSVLGVVVLAGIVAGAVSLYRQHEDIVPADSHEHEPNNDTAQATPLPRGHEVEAYLGRRSGPRQSDIDLFLLRNGGGERGPIRLDVSAIPNMDIVIELYRAGQRGVLLTVNGGDVGQPEQMPNFPIAIGDYVVRVRERLVDGAYPSENVSDPYTIRWDRAERAPDLENEINDSLELATVVRSGERVRGYIGWNGDVDVYCVSPVEPDVLRARVAGVEDLDLQLRLIDRLRGRSVVVNVGAIGEGEDAATVPPEVQCVEVSADVSREGARRARADATYALTIESGAAP